MNLARWRWGASFKVIFKTLFWPTVLLLYARFCPSIRSPWLSPLRSKKNTSILTYDWFVRIFLVEMSLGHDKRSPLIHNEHGGIVTIHYIYCYVIGVQTPHHFARLYFPCHLK